MDSPQKAVATLVYEEKKEAIGVSVVRRRMERVESKNKYVGMD